MRELVGEDIFEKISEACAICITTNCTVSFSDDGFRNPMGGGVAGAARRRWPEIELDYGQLLMIAGNVPVIVGSVDKDGNEYLNSEVTTTTNTDIGTDQRTFIVCFPTMHSIMEPADLKLVLRSAELLVEMTDRYNWKSILLACPGVGIGSLDVKLVMSSLKPILDDRFSVMLK